MSAKAAARRRGFRVMIEYRGRPYWAWADRAVPLPAKFCLDQNYEESAQKLNFVRERLIGGLEQANNKQNLKRRIRLQGYFDLSSVVSISPSAALVFASEFDRSRHFHKLDYPVIERRKWRRQVSKMLSDIGFFDLLEIPVITPDRRDDRIVQIARFTTGKLVGNREAGDLIALLGQMVISADIDAFEDPALIIRRARLFDALVEATENARQHAYPEDIELPFSVKQWWMTGAVEPDEKRLTIAVYDQGISIPASLPRWEGFGWVRKVMTRALRREPDLSDESYDSVRLRLAMEMPRSSTGMGHRGKGLPLLRAVVDHCRKGRLRIVSRRGALVYETGRKLAAEPLKAALHGTLVEWDLWL